MRPGAKHADAFGHCHSLATRRASAHSVTSATLYPWIRATEALDHALPPLALEPASPSRVNCAPVIRLTESDPLVRTHFRTSLDNFLEQGSSQHRAAARQVVRPCGRGILGQGSQHAAAHHPHDAAPPLAGGDHHRLDLHRRDAAAVDPAPARPGGRPGAGRAARPAPARRRARAVDDRADPAGRQRSLRGIFTLVQNYYGESVGHHDRLRAAPRLLREDAAAELFASTTRSTPAT